MKGPDHPLVSALVAHLARMPETGFLASGKVTRYDGMTIETTGFPASPGTLCRVETETGAPVLAEVVGFRDGRNLLFAIEPKARIFSGASALLVPGGQNVGVGNALLGRALDAMGAPLDGLPMPAGLVPWPLNGHPLNPLARKPVDTALDVGVRAINAALTLAEGQRIGIIAGSGVGKSVLIEMMARHCAADVVVLALIGERAREVGHFVRSLMAGPSRDRTCLVAVPADRSPLLRLRGTRLAISIAEWFRSQGQRVLLVLDSLTRVAHAQREIGLALGEQPTAKGYPPSVVATIPALLERAGPGLANEGTITAICTVLADGDDVVGDPVVDTARAILDGHIVLSRRMTQMGMFPAIDLTQSVSRTMPDVTDTAQQAAALHLRALIAAYLDNRDLVLMGGHTPGQDKTLDAALQNWPKIRDFLSQDRETAASLSDSRQALFDLLRGVQS